MRQNSITAIHPYKHEGVWVFDDATVGLVQEAFVAGADVLIDKMTERIEDAEHGFTLLFSNAAFPGSTMLQWMRPEESGNWYYSSLYDLEGWLCPALLKYFDVVPMRIFVSCQRRRGK